MSATAKRRRDARKANKFSKAQPAPLKRFEGCMERCPVCLTRCMGGCCMPAECTTHHGEHNHWFACDH